MLKSALLLALFSLLTLLLPAQSFQHVSAAGNIESGWTYLDHPQLNNNPAAIIHAVWISGPSKGKNIGVWYYAARGKWAIFHQDRSPMAAGNVFTVYPGASFVHVATGNNIDSYTTAIDNPRLNGHAEAKFSITANWNPNGQGGTYDDHSLTVTYKGGRWLIVHSDQTPIPPGAAFNILLENTSPIANGAVTTTNINPDAINRALQTMADSTFTNWGFENGLEGWMADGNAFDVQPTYGDNVMASRVRTEMFLTNNGIGGDYWKNIPYPIGFKGRYWIGTYENHPTGNERRENGFLTDATLGQTQGDAPTGTLTSPEFKLYHRYITFLVGGGRSEKVRVELQMLKKDFDAMDKVVLNLLKLVYRNTNQPLQGEYPVDAGNKFVTIKIGNGMDREELRRMVWELPVEYFRGKTFRIKIVDGQNDGWGHINVDDFRFTDAYPALIAGLYDADAPVWGFADTHTHPAANLGFGGSLMWGTVSGPPGEALHFCRHGMLESAAEGSGSEVWPLPAGTFGHNNKGPPVFSFWPSFTDRTHQTLYIDWIKRAYDGGLRIIAALAVNNTTMAFGLNKGSYPDKLATQRELDELNRVFGNLPWAAIATTPREARAIIKQNKLAVVLGIEVDNLEDLTTAEYLYRRNHGGTISAAAAYALPLKPVDAAAEGVGVGSQETARNNLRMMLQDLKQRKVVQITPIHFADNMIGGAAVYNRMFNEVSYQSTGEGYFVTDGSRHGFKYVLNLDTEGDDARNIGTGGNHLYRKEETMEANPLGHMNVKGAHDCGRIFVKEMARAGMIWDIDHSSFLATNDIINEARRYNYPLLSSHTDFVDLCFTGTNPFRNDKEQDFLSFGTSNIHHLTHESMKTAQAVADINALGGMFNPIMTLTNLRWQSPLVANNCPGSSRTWAQKYLYAVQSVPGKGVGLGTDRGMLENVGPRFGNKAAPGISKEEFGNEERTTDLRKRLLMDMDGRTWKQENGVRYASPMRSIYSDMFRNVAHLYDKDQDMVHFMMACLLYKAGARSFDNITSIGKSDAANLTDGYLVNMSINRSDFTGDVGLDPGRFQDRWKAPIMEKVLKGMFAGSQQELENPEGAAGFAVAHGKQPEEITRFNAGEIHRFFDQLAIAWDMATKMEGANEPLRRCTTGYRDWDFNLDGVAHEGMLPDLMQDLNNVGVSGLRLQPLFMSAEEYIRVWERAEAAKNNVHD